MQVVIIGNGAAGNAVATKIKEINPNAMVTLISDEDYPFYSPCVLHLYISGDVEKQRVFLKEDRINRGVQKILGRTVEKIDGPNRKVLLGDGELTFDSLIIATGSQSIIPKIDGIDKKGIFPLKTLGDADGILAYAGRSAAIVGSGPIGVEAAMGLKKMGMQVSIVEMKNRILPRIFDEKPANIIQGILNKMGIETFVGEKAVQVLGNRTVSGLETDAREIKCDMIIMAAGMKPRVDLAGSAGTKIGGLGGILTDERMMTNVESVYACGDCVESRDIITGENNLNQIWPNAVMQGRAAAFNCLGLSKKYRGFTSLVGIDIFGMHAASIGYSTEMHGNKDLEVIEKTHRNNYRRLLLDDGKIVGAQYVGKTNDIGFLFGAVSKRVCLSELKKLMGKRKHMLVDPLMVACRSWVESVSG